MKNTTFTTLLGWYSKLAVEANRVENDQDPANQDPNNPESANTRIAEMMKRHVRELALEGGADGPLYMTDGDCGDGLKPCNGSCIPVDVNC